MAQFVEPAGEDHGIGTAGCRGPAGQHTGRATLGILLANVERGKPRKIQALPFLRIP